MKKKKHITKVLLLLTAVMILSGCSKTDPADKTNKTAGRTLEYAIYIYMCGSTLETKNGAATKNITEMLQSNLPDGTEVIIETGGAKKWRNYDISADATSRYRLNGGSLELLDTLPQSNMGNTETLSDFLTWSVENYPAEKMGVILWNHGGGSLSGVCFDEQYGMDGLTLDELDAAFSLVSENMTDSFEFIGFDACLMANYETAHIVSKYARNMIASEEIEPSGGWDYDSVLSEFGGKDYYTGVLEGYSQKCEAAGKSCYTLSYINLTAFDKVVNAFADFCGETLSGNAEEDLQAVSGYAEDSMNFGANGSTEGSSNLIDLSMFAEYNSDTTLPEVLSEFVKCINGTQRNGAGGLSFYFPIRNTDDTAEYLEITEDENYSDFLTKYYLEKQENFIEFTDKGSDSGGELHFALTEDSLPYVKSVNYKIYHIEQVREYEEQAVCLGIDSDVVSDGSGGYTTSFEGKWAALNGILIQCEAVDRIGSITIFTSPVKCNGENGNLRFSFDVDTGIFELLGFIPLEENGRQGRLNDIVDGDEIIILQEVIDVNYEHSTLESEPIIADGSLELSVQFLPEGYYQFYAIVTDLYGNEYCTNTILSDYKGGVLTAIAISEDVDHTLE